MRILEGPNNGTRKTKDRMKSITKVIGIDPNFVLIP
jgi:hypothetical protein